MEIDVLEALRYVGIQTPDSTMLDAMHAVADELTAAIKPRSVYRVCGLEAVDGGYALTGTGVVLTGASARLMLEGSHKAVLLVCTLGTAFDAMLRTWQQRDIARAVLLDACGSAYVEAGCDALEQELREAYPGLYLTDRFSPGYGDLPLALQP